jgi:succinate dehydrogenase/fumarate reductase flavoprotein subunit
METDNEGVLEVTDAPDAVMDDDFDVKTFIGTMERKAKKLLAARKRVEELRDERELRAALTDAWDD